MTGRTTRLLASIALAAIALGGCSSTGDLMHTSSVTADSTAVAAAPRIDPACASLASQIDTLRQDGTIAKLEKAAAGKSSSVQIKRASLAKQAELNQAYADFQAKCGPQLPRTAQAATPAPATAAKVAPIAATATASATPPPQGN